MKKTITFIFLLGLTFKLLQISQYEYDLYVTIRTGVWTTGEEYILLLEIPKLDQNAIVNYNVSYHN